MRGFGQILFVAGVFSLGVWGCTEDKVDFSAEVKPILNKHCISCHGGVKRNANFSLLFRQEALDTTESGKPSIIPGHPELSEMIKRLSSDDPEERMPYKEEPLNQEEIDLLTRWVKQGAVWGDHWAYVPVKPETVPNAGSLLGGLAGEDSWAKNEIDQFVLAKLDDEQLKPSKETDKETLIRRLYLDITGLPPTPAQATSFLNDKDPGAYEVRVDSLLASPRYGEKWAAWWLDMARYSDTKGYERDVGRTIWRYRDWVINAFNRDMPYNQFTIEQLAGDLLPEPTDDQLIATAFHRNTMNNDEGGTEDEEFRVAALIDRVSTTWEVWQSTTMACVQCHTHPYDPFVHDEYYKSMAFFNNTRDEDTEAEHPNLRTYQEEDQAKLERIKQWVRAQGGPEKASEMNRFLKTLEPKYHPHDFDQFENGELIDTKWLGIRPGGRARLKQIDLTGKTHLVMNYWTGTPGSTMQIRLDKPDGPLVADARIGPTQRRKTMTLPLTAVQGKHDLYFTFINKSAPPQQPVCAVDWFAFREDLPGKGQKDYAAIEGLVTDLLNTKVENTPVMIENMPAQHRPTAIFERGNWLVKGREVTPDVPRSLNAFPANAPRNRLGFAQWMTDPANPLTARTAVNRFWEQLFGYGLVETLEDFGTQGAAPTHRELLDWLAWQLVHEDQWSMKHLVKRIVMSATYRQDSRVTPELYARDQTNRLLARGPRVRLTAEEVRDQALAAAGLLSPKMHGPSVMPYQPKGIWSSVWSGEVWSTSNAEDQYRRSLYTYSKRTSPYPSMMIFDGSSREVCVSRRIRTNTPLQALVTLNDSTYTVASRSFAHRMTSAAKTPADQIRAGYKVLVIRDIAPAKLTILNTLYDEALKKYKTEPSAAAQLLARDKATPEEAAMTVVASAMLNLDEVLVKE